MKFLPCKMIAIGYFLMTCWQGVYAQKSESQSFGHHDLKMSWWREAKFGMFIHWGLYALPAGKWGDKTTYGEWTMWSNQIPRQEYAKFAAHFNPTKFDAESWVKLAKAAGQKYLIITAKHHDGFALFKSSVSNYSVVDGTPFKRDVIQELADACRKYNMKLGLYYSQAQDWYHPGGAVWGNKQWDSTHVGEMSKYIDQIAVPQVREILSKYGDIAVLWWDTPVGMTRAMAEKLSNELKPYPNLIFNNRLGGGMKGDLETPEQFIPSTGLPGKSWEVCMTMNGHWGYNAYDERWKSKTELLRKLIDIVSKGGNFLLNVGPDQSGVIPEICQQQLSEIGNWLSVNKVSIYGTSPSPFPYLPWGRATQKGQWLYLHVFDWPSNHQLKLPLTNKVTAAFLLEDAKKKLRVKTTSLFTTIQLPVYPPDRDASVIALHISGLPRVPSNPSRGRKVNVSSNRQRKWTDALTDENPQTTWIADKNVKTDTLEMDLKTAVLVHAIGLAETSGADAVLKVKPQNHRLQGLSGNVWQDIAEFTTDGAGTVKEFKPVKFRRFRLIVQNKNSAPSLSDWTLFQSF